MSEQETPLSKQHQLAVAIAQGKSVAAWASQNQMRGTTAFRWADDPDVRRQVQDLRRRHFDRALGNGPGITSRFPPPLRRGDPQPGVAAAPGTEIETSPVDHEPRNGAVIRYRRSRTSKVSGNNGLKPQ